MTSPSKAERQGLSTEAALTGILALLVEQREERSQKDTAVEKVEVVLSRAGLSHDEIAVVTGKKADAIRKAIARAKSKKGSK